MDRICPECSATFAPTNGRQVFCTVAHKRNFHRVMANRGQVLLPLALAWQEGSRKGEPHSAWARRQKDGLLRQWLREDADAGRRASLVTGAKEAAAWSYADAA